MNVLMYLNRYPGYGGIEIVTTYLSNYLVAHGINVSILSFTSQAEKLLAACLCDKVNVYHVEASGSKTASADAIKTVLAKEEIDIVVFQDSYAPIEGYLIEALQGTDIKLCTVEHNVPDCAVRVLKQAYSDRLKPYPTKAWLSYPIRLLKIKSQIKKRHRHLCDVSDKYVLLSAKFYTVLEKLIGSLDKAKVTHINNPITIKTPAGTLFAKEKICLFCGRLSKQKGIKYLVEIWSEIERRGTDWTLVVVGDGSLNQYLREEIKMRGLKNIRMDGYQADTAAYYAKASILCMASIFEGWMLTLVEAMVYGCVPITFNSYEAASDIITDGENGFLIKPFNVMSYANTLQALMEDKTLFEKMSRQAMVSSDRFAINGIGPKWIELFNSLKSNT